MLALRKPSVPPVPTSPEAGKSFDQKIQDLETAHQQGAPKEVRINESELNSKLQESIQGAPGTAGGPATVDAATVHIEGERLVGMFTVNLRGKDVYITLGGTLATANRQLQFTPTELKMGSLPIPLSAVESTLRDKLNAPEMQDHMKLRDSIGDVRIENGELVVQSR